VNTILARFFKPGSKCTVVFDEFDDGSIMARVIDFKPIAERIAANLRLDVPVKGFRYAIAVPRYNDAEPLGGFIPITVIFREEESSAREDLVSAIRTRALIWVGEVPS
jgi:hypothetical protein